MLPMWLCKQSLYIPTTAFAHLFDLSFYLPAYKEMIGNSGRSGEDAVCLKDNP
jgi:hypothetical protein